MYTDVKSLLYIWNQYNIVCQVYLQKKVTYKSTIWPRNSTPLLDITPKNENMCPHKGLYVNVCSNIIHNGQKGETQVSINWWMAEQDVVCPHNGTVFNH